MFFVGAVNINQEILNTLLRNSTVQLLYGLLMTTLGSSDGMSSDVRLSVHVV